MAVYVGFVKNQVFVDLSTLSKSIRSIQQYHKHDTKVILCKEIVSVI